MSTPPHITVLCEAVVNAIAPRPRGLYADVTLGYGGHAEEILSRSAPDGVLVGIDRDPSALEASRERLRGFGGRVELHNATMSSLPEILGGRRLDGLVADLGLSSAQVDDPARGMSFRHDGPLDMRMGMGSGPTAWELVRELRESELADEIYKYGDERASRPIARAIKRAIEAGAMDTTHQLASAVYKVLGPPRHARLDPATRTFQALRIRVNNELGELEELVSMAPEVLAEGGVVAIISFHSLEDRIVKHGLREHTALEVLTKKPVEAGEAELDRNPRARSAKLRVARKRAEEVLL